MSCRRDCAVDTLFSCLRGHPRGVRTCFHGKQWRLTLTGGFYAVESWSQWRRRWVPRLAETDPEEHMLWNAY